MPRELAANWWHPLSYERKGTIMEVIESGEGELFKAPDPDGFRAYVREHKARGLIDKVMTEKEAVAKFVADGDYLAYDLCWAIRGPNSLLREIIRQRKKNLGICGKFTYLGIAVLAGGECFNRVDFGYVGITVPYVEAIREGNIRISEWSNNALTMRLQAGAMGIPFLPVRYLGGADAFHYSGAKLVKDPFTGKSVVLLPALNPDVGLIHVHQADIYGNARVFGSLLSAHEVASASRKVIISSEEIIDHEEIRREPGRTTIPHFLVDAVVKAPFGSYPGEMPGLYTSDSAHLGEIAAASRKGMEPIKEYIQKYILDTESELDFLESKVGLGRLLELKENANIKEGYR